MQAAKITSRFDDLHIPYFLDEKNISLGESVQDRVSGGISMCSHLLVIVSPGSHKSPWVPYEIGIAQGLGLTIIPFLTHPSEDPFPFNRDIKYATDIKKLLQYFQNLLHEKVGKVVQTDPDDDALAFAAHHGHKEVVVGKVIEIWAHYSLETMRPLSDLGIDPRLVTFSQPELKDFSHSLKRCGGLREFPPPNQRKFGVAKLPLGTTDDENQIVEFSETDWNTWMSVRTVIEKSLELRYELSNVLPELSHVPQSMSLQFIVRFKNGDILAMKRKGGLASEPNKWAFSAEEQLHEHDFERPSTAVAEHLFRRAFIEEVFGHRESDPEFLDRIWNEDCSRLVHSHRIWSFFLEENTGIFQMFGVYQLEVEPNELRKSHEAAVSSGWGTTDPEGNWYIVSENEITKLLLEGRCAANRLHGDPQPWSITKQDLHQTSLYRLWRLYIALHRQTETMTALKLH